MPLTPMERALRSSAGGNTRWAHEQDRTGATQAARDALMQRYREQADPDGVLPDDERQRRAESLRRADMARLSLAAATAKRKRREQIAVAEAKERVAAEIEAEQAAAADTAVAS